MTPTLTIEPTDFAERVERAADKAWVREYRIWLCVLGGYLACIVAGTIVLGGLLLTQ